MKKFFLIAGANGTGKTTFAKELLIQHQDMFFLNADEVALEIGDKLGLQAGKILLQRLDDCISDNKSILFESTISGNHHLSILDLVRKKHYETSLMYIFLDLVELNVQRVQNRVLLGGHDVPNEDIYRRYSRSIKNFWDTKTRVDKWELHQNILSGFVKVAFGNEQTKILNMDAYKLFQEL